MKHEPMLVVEKKYFVKYTGPHKVLSLSGLGKIKQGEEYEVSKEIAQSVKFMPDWIVIER